MPILGPDETLIVGVPVELEALLLKQVLGHGELHLEPVRRPAGPERGADACGCESVARGFFEERARLIGRRVDGELYVVRVGALDAGFVELAALVSNDDTTRVWSVDDPTQSSSALCTALHP